MIIFTGYPGVAAESVYKSLQRKPNLVMIVDQPSTRSSFPDTHSPINFYSGSLTKIGLKNSRLDKLPKEIVGVDKGGCDSETLKYDYYNQEACHLSCFVDNIVKNCACVPHFAISSEKYKNKPECDFDSLKKNECWKEIATYKNSAKIQTSCKCYNTCKEKHYQVSYSVSSSSIRGNMDQMQEFVEYENTDESQTDLWEQKLFRNLKNVTKTDDNFEFLDRATNYIRKVGEVYAFKNGQDVSEVLEDEEILAKGFSVIDLYRMFDKQVDKIEKLRRDDKFHNLIIGCSRIFAF